MYVSTPSRQPAIINFLRPMRSERAPTTVKNGIPISRAIATTMFAVFTFTFRMVLHVEQSVELSGVPDHALSRGRPEQRNQHILQVRPLGESVLQRLGGGHPRAL